MCRTDSTLSGVLLREACAAAALVEGRLHETGRGAVLEVTAAGPLSR